MSQRPANPTFDRIDAVSALEGNAFDPIKHGGTTNPTSHKHARHHQRHYANLPSPRFAELNHDLRRSLVRSGFRRFLLIRFAGLGEQEPK